jgi:hypothetical protein
VARSAGASPKSTPVPSDTLSTKRSTLRSMRTPSRAAAGRGRRP